MRFLGIDYGSKKVGIALSDEGGEFAIPLVVLKASKKLLDEVVEIAEENQIEAVVMGESRNYKMQPNAILGDTLMFKKELEGRGYKVIMEPEFMTSENAERLQGKHDMLDASAAALILQSYLDKEQK